MTALNGWHPGERLVRKKMGLDKIPGISDLWSYIAGEIPEQHSDFYSTRLPFVPVCILDEEGRPWGSVLAGKGGEIGFVKHPRYNTLAIQPRLWDGDPFQKYLKAIKQNKSRPLIAGIGVELSTRRRNKFAGHITKTVAEGDTAYLELVVNEAIGNCPKYITLRELEPHPSASSVVLEDRPHLSADERLSDEAIAFILAADTVFFGTTYAASQDQSSVYPSHVGMNHRGGRVGFTRVKPSDGRTVILPDFSGNRFMTSLGNVEATPLASLTYISFTTGDILYLSGEAKNLYGSDARAVMPLQDMLTEIYVTGYTFVRDAFPARVPPGYKIQPSPYSPPVKILAEEESQNSHLFRDNEQPKALLASITIHAPTIATFEWESSVPLHINPGQAIIMSFSSLLGSRQYQHMAPRKPSSVNDDFIRTWTVSRADDLGNDSRRYALTMREKPGGVVTGALFSIARKLSQFKKEALADSRDLSLSVDIVGVSGDFVLPDLKERSAGVDNGPPSDGPQSPRHLVWIAGGIGVTPFLAMLAALSKASQPPPFEIVLVISTREPDVLLSLVLESLGNPESATIPSYLKIHIFTTTSISDNHSTLGFTRHDGRIDLRFFEENKESFGLGREDTEIFLCGPDSFESSVRASLGKVGFDTGKVHREGFAY
ncbi:hypothetical protein CPB84DRAFT_1812978 [Gymnopilus junonius]|uniref:Oxidoreductase FAD/NAD(P)-binding domain-containing protein n=1 Tax=Gymnopilus junonius TaxID=109634 RepID=A0A9P5NZ64_GYMJU|nr:hypothetical protein CPB84DRAFT_1812978 [Gymnopilus junonius]